jgi:hypothetical protein
LYRVDTLTDEGALKEEDDNGTELIIPQPIRLQLSFERISATGKNIISVKSSTPAMWNVFGAKRTSIHHILKSRAFRTRPFRRTRTQNEVRNSDSGLKKS